MTPPEGQNLTLNLDFRGHISTFRAKNTHKSEPFEAKNNAQTTPEQLQTKFKKVKKTIFLAPKMTKIWMSIWPKKAYIRLKFRF